MNRIVNLSFAIGILTAGMLLGCKSYRNPWSGTAYQRPGGYVNPPHSIYAPMPSILPSINAKDIVGEGSQDAELESLLMDLDRLDSGGVYLDELGGK
ncbi:MAG: hypothetical protein ACI87E_004115 [Mariniblastus sp.]|jgi:hypothetical protein